MIVYSFDIYLRNPANHRIVPCLVDIYIEQVPFGGTAVYSRDNGVGAEQFTLVEDSNLTLVEFRSKMTTFICAAIRSNQSSPVPSCIQIQLLKKYPELMRYVDNPFSDETKMIRELYA